MDTHSFLSKENRKTIFKENKKGDYQKNWRNKQQHKKRGNSIKHNSTLFYIQHFNPTQPESTAQKGEANLQTITINQQPITDNR